MTKANKEGPTKVPSPKGGWQGVNTSQDPGGDAPFIRGTHDSFDRHWQNRLHAAAGRG